MSSADLPSGNQTWQWKISQNGPPSSDVSGVRSRGTWPWVTMTWYRLTHGDDWGSIGKQKPAMGHQIRTINEFRKFHVLRCRWLWLRPQVGCFNPIELRKSMKIQDHTRLADSSTFLVQQLSNLDTGKMFIIIFNQESRVQNSVNSKPVFCKSPWPIHTQMIASPKKMKSQAPLKQC